MRPTITPAEFLALQRQQPPARARRSRKKEKTPETNLLGQCRNLLTVLGVWFMRINSRVFKVDGAFIRTAAKGTADLLLTIRGIAIWVELKAGKNTQSPAQKAFQQGVQAAGALYWLIYDVKDLQRRLNDLAAKDMHP